MALLGVLVALSGCGGAPQERRADVSLAAEAFGRAPEAGDTGAACALLAPQTREELEQSQKSPCPEAPAGQRLPAAATVRQVAVHGQQAMVVTRSDALFLSRFSSGWKVVAAGCAPRPSQPYQCLVKGG